jgi:hypothetical protein
MLKSTLMASLSLIKDGVGGETGPVIGGETPLQLPGKTPPQIGGETPVG